MYQAFVCQLSPSRMELNSIWVLVHNSSKITFENSKVSLQKPAFLGLSTKLLVNCVLEDSFLPFSNCHLSIFEQKDVLCDALNGIQFPHFGKDAEALAAQIKKPQPIMSKQLT